MFEKTWKIILNTAPVAKRGLAAMLLNKKVLSMAIQGLLETKLVSVLEKCHVLIKTTKKENNIRRLDKST